MSLQLLSLVAGRLTSPCSRRAAARRHPRREHPGPRPAAEGQVVSRTSALKKAQGRVEVLAESVPPQALAPSAVELAVAHSSPPAPSRRSARHRPWHEARADRWRSRGLCGGGWVGIEASARAPQRPTRSASLECRLSGGCRSSLGRGSSSSGGPTNQPLQPTGRGASVPTLRLGRSRPAAEGQVVSWRPGA